MLKIGERICGFTLVELISNGVEATIFRGVNQLGIERAIKVLRPKFL
jgi:hypothetical protein